MHVKYQERMRFILNCNRNLKLKYFMDGAKIFCLVRSLSTCRKHDLDTRKA